jgi:hypothetical protein
MKNFFAAMVDAPRAYGMIPFWFWNDALDEQELLRQLHAFHAGGLAGVIIHARVGLSPDVGYLSDTYFHFVRVVVDACAQLGMKVILYDEGSYPSGSACGAVVKTNPAYAARGLALTKREIEGPSRIYWRPSVGRSLLGRLLCVVLARRTEEGVDPHTLRLLDIETKGLVRLDVDEGSWLAMAVFDVPSGGTIRGVLPEHEDGSATAPAAGDILNPEAVATFIRLTHDQYARHLAEHLGSTVIGMFTDEPNPLGRGSRRGLHPYTPGFEEWLAASMGTTDIRPWLPALWVDYGADTAAFRRHYARGVGQRLHEVFYEAQATWCQEHGLALTGHPSASNDMTSLRSFHWPGQDVVWRWVAPHDDSNLVGAHSVTAKAATSAARAKGAKRVATELLGAFGWQLSIDEAKWLIDWHLARGNNLFIPHAFFYSVREGRAYESEPDLGIHNVWWPHFQTLTAYTRRMSWVMSDCEHLCQVAIAGPGYDLPWQAARVLYENQIDFLYLNDEALISASITAEGLHAGTQTYKLVIIEGEIAPAAQEKLREFVQLGGHVVYADAETDLLLQIRSALPPDILIQPTAANLRVMHVRKDAYHLYALFNEGETPIEGTLEVSIVGSAEWWDPLRQRRCPAHIRVNHSEGHMQLPIALERRESRLLVVDPSSSPEPESKPVSLSQTKVQDLPASSWAVSDAEGRDVEAPTLGDWTSVRELERFSGTLVYRTTVNLPQHPDRVQIDLGKVGETATVTVNGAMAGQSLWAAHRIDTPGSLWRTGVNELQVAVTNSAANFYEGALLPSGLIGPVRLHLFLSQVR